MVNLNTIKLHFIFKISRSSEKAKGRLSKAILRAFRSSINAITEDLPLHYRQDIKVLRVLVGNAYFIW
jgi:hypothetical protein